MTADGPADLFRALVEAVDASDALHLLDRSPPGETGSPSMTVAAERGEEAPRLSVTFEPEDEQIVFRGVYWRSGQFTPGMRERHGLLFRPAVLRVDEDGYRIGDPRRDAPSGDEAGLARHGSAREAAGFLLRVLEDLHGEAESRSD